MPESTECAAALLSFRYPSLLNNQSMVKVVKSGEKNDIFWKVCKSLRDNKTFYSHY